MTLKDFEQVIHFARPRFAMHLTLALLTLAVIAITLAASGLPFAQNWLDCCLAVGTAANCFFAGIHFAAWQLANLEIDSLKEDMEIGQTMRSDKR